MAMLNFKYGLHKNLPAYDANKLGTIYVTSDEHAMYVDLPKTAENPEGRVRLSQIISIPTADDWAKLAPPYSTEAFYYIVDANALLKYVGTKTGEDGSTEHDWKQINSTKVIEEQITALAGRVKAIEDANFAGSIATINGLIEGLGETDEVLTKAVEDLATADTAIDARIDGIDTVLNHRGVVDALPVDGNLNQICVYQGKVYICTTAGATDAVWTEWSDKNVIAAIEGLKTRMEGMATSGNITALAGRIETVEKALNDETTGLIDRAEALEGRADKLDGAVFDTQGTNLVAANAQAISDLDAEVGEATDGKDKNTVYGKIAAANDALATYKATNDELVGAAQQAANAAQGTANEAMQAAADADAKAEARVLKSDFEAFQGTNTTAIAEAKKAGTDAQEALATYKANNDSVIAGITNSKTIGSFADVEAELAKLQPSGDYATKDEAQGYANTVKTTLLGDAAGTSTTGATIYDVKRAVEAAQSDIDTYQTSNDAAIASMKSDIEGAISALDQKITHDMQTADAMVFQGVVGSVADLKAKAAEVEIAKGWTYKANAEIKLADTDTDEVEIEWANNDDQVVHIGDLLIADGTEDDDGVLTKVTWKHIPSGYVADYNPEMTLTTGTNSANINLVSGVDTSLGSVTVAAAEDSSVTVAAEGTQLTIGMAWGQF